MTVAPPEPGAAAVRARKSQHLRIAAGPGVEHTDGSGLERLRMRHRALPERDLDDVGLATRVLGRELDAPIVIAAMTGGTAEAGAVNRRLARAAVEHGLGMALGSGRALLDDAGLLGTYLGRDRPALLLANVGAAQIRHPAGPQRAERLVELLRADALAIHLNALQEAVQPEGEPWFAGVADAVASVVARLAPVPVLVKEVGFGMAGDDVQLLQAAGVAAVDVAGAGGTNWALIEGQRDPGAARVAAAFANWGVPTAEAIVAARAVAPEIELLAGGGVADGVDAAKCLALGADAVTIGRPLLLAARDGEAGEAVAAIVRQLRIAAWLAGAGHAAELGPRHLA